MKTLRNQEIRELQSELEESFEGVLIDKKDKVEIQDEKIIFVNDTPKFFYYDGKIVPTLRLLLKNQILPRVVVDMGAVKFVTKGADIMRPGIVDVDVFSEGDLVCVVDENHNKALGVGVALFESKKLMEKDEGKVVDSIHYVGDEIWGL